MRRPSPKGSRHRSRIASASRSHRASARRRSSTCLRSGRKPAPHRRRAIAALPRPGAASGPPARRTSGKSRSSRAVGLSETLLRLGRDDDAESVVEHARRAFGETSAIELLEARFLLLHDDFAGAQQRLERLAMLPDRNQAASALAWLAIARLGQGDVEGAAAAAEQAELAQPGRRRGPLRLRQGATGAPLKKARATPSPPPAHRGLGTTRSHTRRASHGFHNACRQPSQRRPGREHARPTPRARPSVLRRGARRWRQQPRARCRSALRANPRLASYRGRRTRQSFGWRADVGHECHRGRGTWRHLVRRRALPRR